MICSDYCKKSYNFINTIKGLKKNKSQEPEGKQVNDGLESFNNLLDNADNVESHSSANSSSDVVVTQQLAKVIPIPAIERTDRE